MVVFVTGATIVMIAEGPELKLEGLIEQVTPGRVLETMQARFIVPDRPPTGIIVREFVFVPPLPTVKPEDRESI